MKDLHRIEIIAEHLNGISLPALKRPPVGPGESETEELVVWAVNFYSYSAIAHIRNILDGLLQLLRIDNDAAAFPVCRHIYEWAMQAAYMNQQLSKLVIEKNWHDTFELFLQVDGGNSWMKKHGAKYVPGLPYDEIPDQLRLKKFVAAYEEYQRNFYKKEQDNVKDTYGFLSEHSHPNGACFMAYRTIVGDTVSFTAPHDIALPHPLPYLIDWVICVQKILSLVKETAVSSRLRTSIEALVRTNS